jgi:uncharacterized protein with HEPN domain
MRLDQDRLYDILEAIEAINRYALKGKAEFDRNELVQVWCLKHLEIIGEAAAKLSEKIRIQNSNIPWRQIIGMRNVLIHGYFDVNWNQVWNVVANELDPLHREVKELLEKINEPWK